MMKRALAAVCLLAFAAGPALAKPPAKPAPAAAKPANDLCAGGTMMTLRISKITPNGTMAGFLEAVKEQNAWYKSHGFTENHQDVARIIDLDPTTRAPAVSQTEAMTLHWSPPGMGASGQKDEAWDAFVAKFRANSTIETEKHVCVTK